MEDKKSIIEEIRIKKQELLLTRIKISSGETINLKSIKKVKKEIARLFTKMNCIN